MSVWEFVAGADWRLMTPEYVALTFGAFVVVALLIRRRLRIWKRMGTIEAGLSKMQSEIATILQVQSALITKLNATSKVEIDQRNTAIEMTILQGSRCRPPPNLRSPEAQNRQNWPGSNK
jgi:hypothetical protein